MKVWTLSCKYIFYTVITLLLINGSSFAVAYSTDDVIYEWRFGRENSVEIAADMTLSQFDLLRAPCFNTTSFLRGGNCVWVLTSSYSCLTKQILVQEKHKLFILQEQEENTQHFMSSDHILWYNNICICFVYTYMLSFNLWLTFLNILQNCFSSV